jgi:hypothetical protein
VRCGSYFSSQGARSPPSSHSEWHSSRSSERGRFPTCGTSVTAVRRDKTESSGGRPFGHRSPPKGRLVARPCSAQGRTKPPAVESAGRGVTEHELFDNHNSMFANRGWKEGSARSVSRQYLSTHLTLRACVRACVRPIRRARRPFNGRWRCGSVRRVRDWDELHDLRVTGSVREGMLGVGVRGASAEP